MARMTSGAFISAAALLLVTGTAAAQSTTGSARDSIAVSSALQHYVGFVRQMANDSISTFFTADGELAAPPRPPTVGPAAIKAFLDTFSAYHVLEDSMKVSSLTVHGDTAVQGGTFWQLVVIPAGDTVVAHGGFSATWLRDSTNTWRIRRLSTAP